MKAAETANAFLLYIHYNKKMYTKKEKQNQNRSAKTGDFSTKQLLNCREEGAGSERQGWGGRNKRKLIRNQLFMFIF